MEENKHLCPKCGNVMTQTYEKPALNMFCPKCGLKVATTQWDKIDLDDTQYEIFLISSDVITLDQIKGISKLTGFNFLESKSIIANGKIIFKGNAKEIKTKVVILDNLKLKYRISPEYKY